jgi:crossover junction endodeoxyribonuclease RuvC
LIRRIHFGYLFFTFQHLSVMQMRVLGIDPGSETLGWGVVEGSGSKYSLVDFGTVKSSPRDRFSKRLVRVFEGVAEVIEKFSPDVLSLEEAFYAVNVSVALKLGQVRGVMLLLGEQKGLEIAEYSPRLIKQTVVGYGNAEKHQVQEMVKLLLKMKQVPTPHDAADALAIAICHFHHAGMQNKINNSKLLTRR